MKRSCASGVIPSPSAACGTAGSALAPDGKPERIRALPISLDGEAAIALPGGRAHPDVDALLQALSDAPALKAVRIDASAYQGDHGRVVGVLNNPALEEAHLTIGLSAELLRDRRAVRLLETGAALRTIGMAIDCPVEAAQEGIAAVFRNARLRRVRLHAEGLQAQENALLSFLLSQLEARPGLECALSLSLGNRFAWERLMPVLACRNVADVEPSLGNRSLAERDVELLALHAGKLRSLSLSGCGVDAGTLAPLAGKPLAALSFGMEYIGEEEAKAIARIDGLAALALPAHVRYPPHDIQGGVAPDAWPHFSAMALNSLGAGFCRIDGNALDAISRIASLQELTIAFSRLDAGGDGLGLIGQRLGALKTLNAGGTGLDNAGLARLLASDALEILDVSDNRLDDGAVPVLCRHARLRALDASGNRLTERGVQALKLAMGEASPGMQLEAGRQRAA